MATTLPSLSANTGTLTAAGVGSGLDVKGLVSQLMTVEQRPLTLLARQEASYQAKLSGLGSVQGSLSALQTVAQSLQTAGSAAYSTSVSDSTVLSATADSTAASGNYALQVSKLAQVQKLVSPAPGLAATSSTVGLGGATSITITLGTTSGTPVNGQYASAGFLADPARTPVTLSIDSSNNTLAGIRDAINAANAGVTASIINDGSSTPYRLALTSNSSGAASSMQLTVSGEAAVKSLVGFDPTEASQSLSETQTARNALLTVDGVSVSSASNSVAGAIQGVTLNLTKETTSAVTVAVQRSSSQLSAALSSLVSAYNSANKAMAGASAKGAVLQGNSTVLGIQRQVRALLGGVQSVSGSYTTLSQLGISFQKDGALALDASKLNTALAADVVSASALAAALGSAVKTFADGLLGSSGPIPSATAGINRSITDIGTQRVKLQSRLDATQLRYQKQFSALDKLMSGMTQTSTFLTQQLGNLPNYYNKG
ncbi:MAG: flagellar filament capping protein FliD [Rhodoferax sp.]|nr:flagellar filament capping protein FliD [Rhodoferax sp.]